MNPEVADGVVDAAFGDPPRVVSTPPDAALTETMRGHATVRRRLEQAERAARLEVRVIDRPATVSPDPPGKLRLEWSMLRRRGVRRRVIYNSEGLGSLRRLTSAARRHFTVNMEARVLPGAPSEIAIFDSQIGAISLHATPEGIDNLIIVHPSPLLDTMVWFFEQQWDLAVPLRLTATAAARLTPRDRQLLLLLTSGLDDQTIARHLAISEPVLRRRVHSLLDRLGAETRAQAARYAASVGWIPLRPDDETPDSVG